MAAHEKGYDEERGFQSEEEMVDVARPANKIFSINLRLMLDNCKLHTIKCTECKRLD